MKFIINNIQNRISLNGKFVTTIFNNINRHFISLNKNNLIQLKSTPNFIKEFVGCLCNYKLIVTFVDDKYIRTLNNKFLGRNYVTDVIAFPMQESFDPIRLGEPKSSKYRLESIVLGDIVISVDRARVQAKRFKHSFYEELALLVIHGTLHLLGYDDIKEKDILIMRKKEQEILKTIKFNK